MTVEIFIDSRERNTNKLERKLRDAGFVVSSMQLPVGDYLITNGTQEIFVERKKGADLYSSLFDGRLENQLSDLSQKDYHLLVFVGNPWEKSLISHMPLNFKGAYPSSVTNLITSVAFRKVEGKSIKYLQVPDESQFNVVILYLANAMKKGYLERKKVDSVLNRMAKSSSQKYVKAMLEGMLRKMPRMGSKALPILEAFNWDLMAVLTATPEQLKKTGVKGIGPKTLEWFEKIQKYFRGEYIDVEED